MDEESNAGVETEEEMGADLQDEGVEEDESLSSEDSETDDTDWKALYEKEKLEKENYKRSLTQKRQLRKKPEPVVEEESLLDEEEDDEDDDNKPVTRAELRRVQSVGTVNSVLNTLVSDPDKRNLVKLYYDTRIRQTGTSEDAIRADLQAALDLADAKKLRKQNSEMSRAANQDTTPPLTGSGSDHAPASKAHKFSDDQVRTLKETAKRIGADPDKFVEQAWKNQQGR